MSRVVVIGAHGKVAMRLLPLLAQRGDEVSAVVRNPDHAPDVEEKGASAVVADVASLDVDGLTELLRGHDSVVWSAGAGGGDPERTRAVDRDAAIRTMDAAAAAGATRFVMVSYLGASPEHWPPADNSFRAYAEAKTAADEHLRASDLEWTVLQPGRLTLDEGIRKVEVLDDVPDGDAAVPRQDVAAVVASALAHPGAVRRTLAFRSGSTPVDEVWSA